MAVISIDSRKNRDGDSPLTAAQRTAIQTAADAAHRMASRALHHLSNMRRQSGGPRTRRRRRRAVWRGNPNIVRWFGNDHLSNDQMRSTQIRMRRIRAEFARTVKFDLIHHQSGDRSWRCDEEGTRAVAAYCSPGTPIKLCPRFFELPARERAITIIHELSHKNGHTDHQGAGDPESAQQLAVDDSRCARRNPENYAGFCGEYYRVG